MRRVLLSFLAVCVVILLHYIGLLRPIENGLVVIMNPLIGYFYQKNILAHDFFDIWAKRGDLAQLIKENERLTVQVKEMEGENYFLREENKELRMFAQFFKSRTATRWASCNVVGGSLDIGSNIITIDCGEKDGAVPGLAVVAGDGVYIGKIFETHAYNSQVMLVTDPHSKTAVALLNGARSIGVLEGGFGTGVQIKFIPGSETINEGDLVVTSGLEDNIPRGLVIGTVEVVQKELYEPFQSAVIRLPHDLHKLIIVSVVVPQ